MALPAVQFSTRISLISGKVFFIWQFKTSQREMEIKWQCLSVLSFYRDQISSHIHLIEDKVSWFT